MGNWLSVLSFLTVLLNRCLFSSQNFQQRCLSKSDDMVLLILHRQKVQFQIVQALIHISLQFISQYISPNSQNQHRFLMIEISISNKIVFNFCKPCLVQFLFIQKSALFEDLVLYRCLAIFENVIVLLIPQNSTGPLLIFFKKFNWLRKSLLINVAYKRY